MLIGLMLILINTRPNQNKLTIIMKMKAIIHIDISYCSHINISTDININIDINNRPF